MNELANYPESTTCRSCDVLAGFIVAAVAFAVLLMF